PETQEAPRLLRQFTPSVETSALMQKDLTYDPRNQRLAVNAWSAFDTPPGLLESSQYDILHPTLYTGRMRKLVQALMGFGKQITETSIFDDIDQDFEVTEEEQEEAELTQYQTQVRDNGLQIRYDYRFMRTHGLVTASDGKLWVVEIGMNRGIIAMPLLLHERTTEPEFRDLVYRVGRLEAITMLDEFGGFPTGEAFPGTPEGLESWIRAGRVLRLKQASDMAEFYAHSTYSSTLGWAFNLDGSEAHNTAWRFGDDGVQRGVHYAISLTIGDTAAYTVSENATSLQELLGGVANRSQQMEAVMWKIPRLSEQQINEFLDRLADEKAEVVFDAVDAVELGGIAPGTAGVSKVSEGKIYWPTPKGQPQIKFPEPLVGGLLSHDMRPSTIVDRPSQMCDTTMLVFFAGNELKWVKYFLDGRSAWAPGWHFEGDDDWDIANAPAGDFYKAYVLGPVGVPPMFYTTDFDPREELPVSKFEWFYRRRKIGYTDPWTFNMAIATPLTHMLVPPVNPQVAQQVSVTVIYRTCWFTNDYDFHFATSTTLASSVTAPFHDREAYYFAKIRKRTGGDVHYVKEFRPVNDPWVGSRGSIENHLIEEHNFYPGGGYPEYDFQKEFVDQGPWAPIGTDIRDYRVTNNDDPYHQYGGLFSSVMVNNPAQGTLVVDLVTSSYFGTIRVLEESRSGDENVGLWEPLWFLPSPDDFGDYQFIAETHNVLGGVDCIVYGIHLLNGERLHKGVYPEAANWLSPGVYRYPTFIGVFDG
ncbi:MAG TPA: hypothetical protein PLL30_17850, partial [Candidatus Krumholzibacteria bacterium]|nr:hypothetical protein [Candidatus Krumholzibacteria bacterium]HRY42283.1 hypothetical protein [Candidatus Krumholzibacteria bacterium]